MFHFVKHRQPVPAAFSAAFMDHRTAVVVVLAVMAVVLVLVVRIVIGLAAVLHNASRACGSGSDAAPPDGTAHGDGHGPNARTVKTSRSDDRAAEGLVMACVHAVLELGLLLALVHMRLMLMHGLTDHHAILRLILTHMAAVSKLGFAFAFLAGLVLPFHL